MVLFSLIEESKQDYYSFHELNLLHFQVLIWTFHLVEHFHCWCMRYCIILFIVLATSPLEGKKLVIFWGEDVFFIWRVETPSLIKPSQNLKEDLLQRRTILVQWLVRSFTTDKQAYYFIQWETYLLFKFLKSLLMLNYFETFFKGYQKQTLTRVESYCRVKNNNHFVDFNFTINLVHLFNVCVFPC